MEVGYDYSIGGSASTYSSLSSLERDYSMPPLCGVGAVVVSVISASRTMQHGCRRRACALNERTTASRERSNRISCLCCFPFRCFVPVVIIYLFCIYYSSAIDSLDTNYPYVFK
eukprot:scaffold84316_cov54-Attheya_sp.AAC.1